MEKEKLQQVSINFSDADLEKIKVIEELINLKGRSSVVRYGLNELYKKVNKKKNENS